MSTVPPPIPHNEAERLERLRELFVLDSEPEEVFDSIARLASQVCGVPMALISLVDEDRQWFKATIGVEGITETPRDISFCAHAIFHDTVFEVADTTLDPRFMDNPIVTGELGIRFYAGAQLKMPGGEQIGTLCVFDRTPHELTDEQTTTLRTLSRIAVQALTMRRDLIVRALSVRSEYEKKLEATADELADLYENAPCGYYSLDPTGMFVRINNTALKWLGRSREEVLGQHRVTDFLDDDGRQLFAENFPRLLATDRVADLEFALVGRHGTRPVVANATLVRDAEGRPMMSRTVLFDVTELQRVKRELCTLTRQQQAILDTDLIGILKFSDRRIIWANAGIERMLAYEPDELLDQPTRLLYGDEATYQDIGAKAYPVMAKGLSYRRQLPLARKDGARVWVDMMAMAMPSSPGELICMLVDISPLKEAEAIRLRAATLEADNRQLVESNRVKGLFLANMSHELHTPLNAVIGYAHLLQAGAIPADSPKFANYLKQIDASGRELLGLIDAMLNLAKVESGRFDFEPERVDLTALVDEVAEMMQSEVRQKGITLAVGVDPGLEALFVDPLRLTQVLSQFLSNAIKFSHAGATVSVRASLEGPDAFRVEIEDTGIGIAEHDLPRLFNAFQQLSEGRAKAYPGAGLGLALAKRLVEAQGGSVGVTSRLGDGSSFHFVLPLHAAEDA